MGENGNIDTDVTTSGLLDFQYTLKNGSKISIDSQSNMSIELCIPRSPAFPIPPFTYMNSSNITTSFNTYIVYHVVQITGTNASARVQISPNSLDVGYLACFKFTDFPDVFKYPPDCDVLKVFCPFGNHLKNFSIIFLFLFYKFHFA